MQTVADLKAAIRAHGYATDTAGEQIIMLNSAQRDIAGDHRWRFLLSELEVPLVAGQGSYLLAPTPPVHHIEAVSLVDSAGSAYIIEHAGVDALDELAQGRDFLGEGYAWTELGPGILRVFPLPTIGGTLTVRYAREVAELAADTDVPDIPRPYRDVLVAAVCEKLAVRERQPDAKAMFADERERRLGDMKAQYGLRQHSSYVRDSRRASYDRFRHRY